MHDMILAQNLSKSYGKKRVFQELSFALPEGRVIGLLGENGVGKTTLLRLIANILQPEEGSIHIAGQKVSRKTGKLVSYLLDASNLYAFMTVQDAVQYYKDFYADFDREKALALCEEFHLELKERISSLSKGNQERVCLLLALSRDVPVYLLDEPVAGFDPKFKQDFVKILLKNLPENATVILSTHLLRDLSSIFDEVMILKKDGIVMENADAIRKENKTIEEFYMEVLAG